MGKTGSGGGRGQRMAATRRASGWTVAKERRFLEALSDTCNVTLAAKLAGIGNTTVYSRRAKDAAFRNGWLRAIAQGYARLEIETLERALNGSARTIVETDGRKVTVVEYNDRVALALLRMHRDAAEAPAKAEREDARWSEEEVAEVRAKLAAKLERVRLGTVSPLLIEATVSEVSSGTVAVGEDADGQAEA